MLIKRLLKRALLATAVTAVVFVSGAGADDIQLPDIGSPADAVLSKTTESPPGEKLMCPTPSAPGVFKIREAPSGMEIRRI